MDKQIVVYLHNGILPHNKKRKNYEYNQHLEPNF